MPTTLSKYQYYDISQLVNPAIRICQRESHEQRAETKRRGFEYVRRHHPEEDAVLKEYGSIHYFTAREEAHLQEARPSGRRRAGSGSIRTIASPETE